VASSSDIAEEFRGKKAEPIPAILAARERISSNRALLVGISGIDASGKGFVTALLDEQLRGLGWNTAVLTVDDWLNPLGVCIHRDNPAPHFYEQALRLDEMFAQLILPLKQNRSVDLMADCGDAKSIVLRKKRHSFSKIDIVLLEGIFLFKLMYRDHFDIKVWIDCSFETALERAIARGQEGLEPAETKRAFEMIYFPAQLIHLTRDDPRANADLVIENE